MNLDTNEGILQEVREIAEFEGRDLRQWLYREILLNALKTKRDELDILDLKVVSRTMDEFRYAARVFKPYRGIRKVSIFGSARVPKGAPHYKLASDFGRQMAEQGVHGHHRRCIRHHEGRYRRCRPREQFRGGHPAPI